MSTWIKAGFWQNLCPSCSGYKGWLNLTEFVKKLIGGGTPDKVAKFGPDGSLVDSSITDDGTNVGVKTPSPTVSLELNGSQRLNGNIENQTFTNQLYNSVSTWYIGQLIEPSSLQENSTTSTIAYAGVVSSIGVNATSTGAVTSYSGYFVARGRRDTTGTLNLYGVSGFAIKNDPLDQSNGGSVSGGSYNAGHQSSLNNSVVSSSAYGTSSAIQAQKGTITNAYGSSISLNVSGSASSSGTVGNFFGFYTGGSVGRSDGTTTGTVTSYYDAYFAGLTVYTGGTVTNRWGVYQANALHDNYFAGNVIIGSSPVDTGDKLQVQGAIRTENPVGGTAQPWKLGSVSATSPTSPNVTIEVEINGVTYYLHAKTTND